ncbi:transglutaminase-like cysteine peptidase [Bradyrhizobium sp. PRIMUS42]|uniref:transglutaminase-like cysteine peptidase n=1 Tax=Bradyrhizobium sp. PRIMUS42 TaxID=2908926 RepID=UPI001FF5B852|nr:transglutaminase-like cysteine peptidase [Bradyrhizobium sp. PRIMUS42]MCJ9734181.1 transglutaminase-like cysteine peptidase [Bradyrhizobium sp. PRIMUS42]
MIRHATRMLAIVYCVCSQPAYSSYESQAVTPPLSFSQFCVQNPEDCQRHEDRRIRDFRSSIQRWRELAEINSTVNFSIAPKDPLESRSDAEWQIFPYDGNCGDYAVTKRHLLLRSGWPSSALLLAEVVIRTTAEHHLVLLVREGRAVLVLDNLSPVVTPLVDALDRYIFVRAESGVDPQRWTREVAHF